MIEAVAAGATGYLQKYTGPEELVEAVLDVAEGRLRIPTKVVREVFAMVRGSRELASRQATNRLTALERDTLTLFASGRSYPLLLLLRPREDKTVTAVSLSAPHKARVRQTRHCQCSPRRSRPRLRSRRLAPVADAGLVEGVGGVVGVVAQLAAELLRGGAHSPGVAGAPQAPDPLQQPVVGHRERNTHLRSWVSESPLEMQLWRQWDDGGMPGGSGQSSLSRLSRGTLPWPSNAA